MKLIKVKTMLLTLLAMIMSLELQAQEHPKLIMTKVGVEKIRANLDMLSSFYLKFFLA